MLRSSRWLVLSAVGLFACGGTPGESTESSGSDVTSCASGQTIEGLDVSKWDGSIDWKEVKASGRAFAFVRVSDGLDYPDSTFATNWSGARSAGLYRGAYQYFEADQNATSQANLVLDALGSDLGELPVVVDVEVTDGESASTIRSAINTWSSVIENGTGRAPIVYVSPGFWSSIGGSSETDGLWVANWDVSCPSLPSAWSSWQFWQYSDAGDVPGISGQVDVNRFNGSLAQLAAYAAGGGGSGGSSGGGSSSGSSGGGSSGSSSGGFERELQRRLVDLVHARRRDLRAEHVQRDPAVRRWPLGRTDRRSRGVRLRRRGRRRVHHRHRIRRPAEHVHDDPAVRRQRVGGANARPLILSLTPSLQPPSPRGLVRARAPAATVGPRATTAFFAPAAASPSTSRPVWFMRQAGRYMPEYRKLREKHTLLELCKTPELAAQVTLQPMVHGVDAAILFADILLPLEPMGAPFEFAKGEGPVVHEPIRSREQIDRLRVIEPEDGLGYVLSAIRMLRKELEGAAHRLRRRAVHARELPHRGRQERELREDQEADVRRARGLPRR